jgi:hypothetical protein
MSTEFMCSRCSKPVSLEDDKTDEKGQPVHEDCYINKLSAPPNEEQKQEQLAS